MSKGDTPEATESEKKLAALGNEMADIAANLTGGRDYIETQATLDKSERYEEQALGVAQAAGAATVGANEQAPIISYDQRDKAGIGIGSEAQSDLEQIQNTANLAGADLGQTAVASSAETKLGYDEMAVEQAKYAYEQQKDSLVPQLLGAAAGTALSYGMNSGTGFGTKTDVNKVPKLGTTG